MFALRFPFPTLLSYCMERPLKQKRLPVTRSSLHFDYLSKIFLTFSAQNYCKVESTQIWLICHYCIFCTTLCCFLNSHIASLIEITNTKKKTTKNNKQQKTIFQPSEQARQCLNYFWQQLCSPANLNILLVLPKYIRMDFCNPVPWPRKTRDYSRTQYLFFSFTFLISELNPGTSGCSRFMGCHLPTLR